MDFKLSSVMKERDFQKTVDSTMHSGQLKAVNMLKIAKKAIEKYTLGYHCVYTYIYSYVYICIFPCMYSSASLSQKRYTGLGKVTKKEKQD